MRMLVFLSGHVVRRNRDASYYAGRRGASDGETALGSRGGCAPTGPVLLVEAVRAAVAGDVLISPSVTVRLLRQLTEPRFRDLHEPLEPLTASELEVARLVAPRADEPGDASELFIWPGTAKTRRKHPAHARDARNRVGISAWAWDAGRVTG